MTTSQYKARWFKSYKIFYFHFYIKSQRNLKPLLAAQLKALSYAVQIMIYIYLYIYYRKEEAGHSGASGHFAPEPVMAVFRGSSGLVRLLRAVEASQCDTRYAICR